MIGAVTVDELVDVMTSAGHRITAAAVRYHCRDPRGALYGIAVRRGQLWLIPTAEADKFAAGYARYGTLQKSGRGGGHPLPDRPADVSQPRVDGGQVEV